MKYYETMVIIHPALEKGHLKDNVVNVQDNIQKYGGDLLTTDVWGKKRLAYYVEKQKYGTFTLFQYTGENIKFNDFNSDLEHDTNVLAYMTTKIEKHDVKEQTEDLDSQIDGRSKVTTTSEEKVEPTQKAKTDSTPDLIDSETKPETEPSEKDSYESEEIVQEEKE